MKILHADALLVYLEAQHNGRTRQKKDIFSNYLCRILFLPSIRLLDLPGFATNPEGVPPSGKSTTHVTVRHIRLLGRQPC